MIQRSGGRREGSSVELLAVRRPSVPAFYIITLPNRTTLVGGTATDDGRPAGASLTARWSMVSGPGAAVFGNPLLLATQVSFDAPGVYQLRLTAQDGDLAASDDMTVTVIGTPPAGDAPTVAITSPSDLTTVTAPIEVRGTVTSASLVAWRLQYQDKSQTDEWQTIATGDTPLTDAVLGRFDPSLLLNGIYQLRLVATDTSGRMATTPEDQPALNVRGNFKVGQFSLSFLELSVPVSGIPIQLLRNYDSRDTRKGDFGFGWTLGASGLRVTESGKMGRAWTGLDPLFRTANEWRTRWPGCRRSEGMAYSSGSGRGDTTGTDIDKAANQDRFRREGAGNHERSS